MAKLISSKTTVRVVANTGLPEADTVYEWGEAPSAVLPGQIVWPAAGAENALYTGTDANYVYMHFGYGGAVYMPDVGAQGTMVFGYTGEATFCEQMTAFDVEQRRWSFFQQPSYATSLAEAVATDADWYYSEADFAALPAARKVPRGFDEATWAPTWDRGFPIGYANWVGRRKIQTSYLGNNRPHWFRYGMPAYLPASVTGTGAGAIVVNSRGTIYGPFAQGPAPTQMPDADWYADVWPSGHRKHFLHVMNVATKQWSRHPSPIPDRDRGSAGEAYHPQSAWDPSTGRLYYSLYDLDNAVYWADVSKGLGSLTWGGPLQLTDVGGASWAMLGDDGNSLLCVPPSGVNAGRRLWYFKHNRGDSTPCLGLVDLDHATILRLPLSGLPPTSDVWGLAYNAKDNLVYLTTKGDFGVRCYRFAIPNDPTNAASYSVSMKQLAFASGVTLEAGSERTKQLGQRNQYLPALGLILMTQRYGKMLAYRPG